MTKTNTTSSTTISVETTSTTTTTTVEQTITNKQWKISNSFNGNSDNSKGGGILQLEASFTGSFIATALVSTAAMQQLTVYCSQQLQSGDHFRSTNTIAMTAP